MKRKKYYVLCWWCGYRVLRAPVVVPFEGHPRRVHVACGKSIAGRREVTRRPQGYEDGRLGRRDPEY